MVTQETLDHYAKFEGGGTRLSDGNFSYRVYFDSVGIPTIGWGFAGGWGPEGPVQDRFDE
jgi:GH24 family phage-related lysozyme (muramidase)